MKFRGTKGSIVALITPFNGDGSINFSKLDELVDFHIENHTDGTALYRFCREKGLGVRISPAPRAATVCCGMSLLVSPDEIDAVRACIAESGIPILKIAELPRQIDPKRDVYC